MAIVDVLRGDPDAVRCPYPHYQEVEDRGGIYLEESIDVYVVTDNRLISQVNTNPAVFSSRNPMGPTVNTFIKQVDELVSGSSQDFVKQVEIVRSRGAVLFTADPPVHTRHRKFLNKALTPRAVTTLEPRVREIANELIDSFIRDGRVDLVPALRPLPVLTLIELLGLPAGMAETFSRWEAAINASVGRKLTLDQVRSSIEGSMEFWEYFKHEFADRIACPRDDLLSALVMAREENERPLDIDEMIGFASQFVGAGSEATHRMIISAMYLFCTIPEVAARIRPDYTLIPRLLEEALRLEAPAQGLFRLTTQDTRIGDQHIPVNSWVYLVYAAANRNPDIFESPDDVVLDRPNMFQHLSFGHGPHSCIGSALARMMGRVVFEEMLTRLSDISLEDPGARPEYDVSSYLIHGISTLPVRFEAREEVTHT
jgi:cytochrome P450